MKNFIILLMCSVTQIAFGACPIDGESTSCSIAEFQQPQPMQRTFSPKSTIKEFAGSPEARLKPSQNENRCS